MTGRLSKRAKVGLKKFLLCALALIALSGCSIPAQPMARSLSEIPPPNGQKMPAIELVMPQELRDLKLSQRSFLAGLANTVEAQLGHDVEALLDGQLRRHFSEVTLSLQRSMEKFPAIIIEALDGTIASSDLSVEIRLIALVDSGTGRQRRLEMASQGQGDAGQLFWGGAFAAGAMVSKTQKEALQKLSMQFDGVIGQLRADLTVPPETRLAAKTNDLENAPQSTAIVPPASAPPAVSGTGSQVPVGVKLSPAEPARPLPIGSPGATPAVTGRQAPSQGGAPAINDLALGYYQQGLMAVARAQKTADFQGAADAFARAVVAAPEWPVARYNLGRVLAELDRPYGTILALRKYLELAPDAPNRLEVTEEISRQEEIHKARRWLALPGVKLVAMEDGIHVVQLAPESQLARMGLRRGDRITQVNGKPVAGASLVEFFRIIEEWKQADAQDTGASDLHRYRSRKGVLLMQGVRGGDSAFTARALPNDLLSLLMNLEGIELEEVVRKSPGLTVGLFWADWCMPCEKLTPIAEKTGKSFAGMVDFYSINAGLEQDVARRFDIRAFPTFLLFREGREIARKQGMISSEELRAFVDKHLHL